jgi:hypothetical protein
VHGVILSASSAHSPLGPPSFSGGELHRYFSLCNPCYWDCIRSIHREYKCYVSLSSSLASTFLRHRLASPTHRTSVLLGCDPVFQGIHQVYKPAYIGVAPDRTSMCPFVSVSTNWKLLFKSILGFFIVF